MKDRPGLDPQWPSRRFLMCSGLSGSLQQGIVVQVDHPQAEVIAGAPVGVGLAQFVRAERRAGDGGPGCAHRR